MTEHWTNSDEILVTAPESPVLILINSGNLMIVKSNNYNAKLSQVLGMTGEADCVPQ